MYTNNYEFAKINAIKLLVENSKGQILLIQEPETNDWMPLHWGLPGGKPTETESIQETVERKINGDVGGKAEVLGIVRVEELLIKGKTVLMFIALAKTDSDNVDGEAEEYKWVSKDDIEKMKIEDFTEFYNKKLLLDYFEKKLPEPTPLSVFMTEEYYKMENNSEYKKWFESGTKK